MFVFLFLFLFRQTKDKADQGDEYLAVFVQLELSDTSYFAELVERNRFLTDHIFEGVIRKEDISRGMFAFGNLLAELLERIEQPERPLQTLVMPVSLTVRDARENEKATGSR